MATVSPAPHPAPSFVVRVAGLPVEVLRDLRFDQTMKLADELLERQGWLRSEGERLSDELYTVVGTVKRKPIRYRLLSLRRNIYHGRPPKSGETDHDVMATLPPDVAQALHHWLAELSQCTAINARVDETLSDELASKRLRLRRACAHPALLSGLVLASPELFAEVIKWLSAPGADPHLETTLTKYLARTVMKTSPFSTLTSTASGQWRQDGSERIEHKPTWSRKSVVELNLLITRAIIEALRDWPEVRSSLVVRANASLVDKGDRARFLIPGREDSVAELTASPTVRQVLDAIDYTQGRAYPKLVRLLASIDPAVDEIMISAFLDHLVHIGLLEARLPIRDQSSDHLGDLCAMLDRHRGPRLVALRELVGQLRDLLVDYADQDMPADRAASVGKVAGVVGQISHQLHIPADVVGTKNLFYEDTVADVNLQIPFRHWDAVRDDVGVLHRLAALYDMSLPARLADTEFFTTRYGHGARKDVVTFFRDRSHEAGPPPAGLAEITAIQQQLAAEVIRCPVDNDRVRHLDPAVIRATLARSPGYLKPPRTLTLHCQLLGGDETTSIVINDLYHGRSRSLARQLRLCRTVGRPGISQVGESPVYADLIGHVGTNLELRAPLTDYEITYPGGVSGRPALERIALGELDAVHDPVTNRLRLVQRGTGRKIIPQYLGNTAIFLLPPISQFLLDVFGEASYVYIRQGLSGLVWRTRTREVERIPRLCLGRIVINRARWVASTEHIPRRFASPAAHLVELTRWRREHGIPEQCFVRVVDPATQRRSSVTGKSRKPVYLDFGSYLFAGVLGELIKGRRRLVMFEEVLPGPDDAVVTTANLSYATELVLESILHD